LRMGGIGMMFSDQFIVWGCRSEVSVGMSKYTNILT
jgi:hypothetical protein